MLKNISSMTKDKDILDIPAFLRDLSDTDSKDKVIPEQKKEEIVWPTAQPVKDKEKIKEEKKQNKPKVDIQARMKEQSDEYFVDVRDIIDCTIQGVEVESVYDFLKEQNIAGAYCSKLIEACEQLRSEYTMCLETRAIKQEERTEDQQMLYESYDCFSLKEMKDFIAIHDQAISDIERWSKIKQGEKKARKPRAMSVERMIKKLQYKKEDSKYKLQSIDPILIPRCQQVWVFNTKTRKLSQYNAVSRNGIMIKGTTLKDFDTNTSVSKTVRKPEDVLTKLITTDGKIALRNIWSNIKTLETKGNGRINTDTILLKVMK
jgi:hypothetical protein